MAQLSQFLCVIEDRPFRTRFHARVTVSKRQPARKSLQTGKIDLADIFIQPLSAKLDYFTKAFDSQGRDKWEKKPARFNVGGAVKSENHSHFVLYDSFGNGLYIVRDQYRREIDRVECSIWDLGNPFATRVTRILKEFA